VLFLISGCSNVKNEGSGVVADVAVAFELEEETISSLREKLSSGNILQNN
jgi:amidase